MCPLFLSSSSSSNHKSRRGKEENRGGGGDIKADRHVLSPSTHSTRKIGGRDFQRELSSGFLCSPSLFSAIADWDFKNPPSLPSCFRRRGEKKAILSVPSCGGQIENEAHSLGRVRVVPPWRVLHLLRKSLFSYGTDHLCPCMVEVARNIRHRGIGFLSRTFVWD